MVDANLWSLVARAGWTMAPLVLCSVIALAVTVFKAVQFSLEKVDHEGALQVLERPPETWSWPADAPLARVLRSAADVAPEQRVIEAERVASVELARYDAYLPILSYIAQAAPLFGLLGTVVGMVQLFADMEAAGDAVATSTLSSGIWQALLTTAVGLMIAIPTIGAHLWLSRRVDRLQGRIEQAVRRMVVRSG